MSDGDHPGADDDAGSRGPGEPSRLKDLLGGADDTDVLDGLAGLPRLTWDAVTDTGGTPTDRDTPARPSSGESTFQFDLGGALARLAGDGPPPDDAAAPRTADQVPPSHEAVPPVAERSPERAPEPFVAPPSPSRPPSPSLVTRPIEPMTYESVVREPSTPPAGGHAPPRSTSARVEESEPTPPDAYPRRVPGTHLGSHMRPESEPEAEAVPEIREATPADASPRPVARLSVFDDLPSGSGPAAAPSLPSSAPRVPTAAPGASPAIMPSLPASNPAAPPPVAAPVTNAPSNSDINALRAAQLRASKQQRQGKMFGRTLLAFVVIGGLIAAALVFGRSLLFDTEWDAQLTPIVNEIEAERGSFARPVPLETLPAPEFGERLRMMTIGDEWIDRVPEWRALGLATGVVAVDVVDGALAQTTFAVYDAESDTIYQRVGVDEADASADLRVALEQAFVRQTGAVAADASSTVEDEPIAVDDGNNEVAGTRAVGFTGISPLQVIAARAVDTAIATGSAPAELPTGTELLPIPIAYELSAVELLGEPILLAAGIDPDTLPADTPYPDAIVEALDDAPVLAPGGILRQGDVELAPAAALGIDDWSMVWSTRLPSTTVAAMRERVIADSYRPLDRNGTACFIGVFRTTDEASNAALFADLGSWVASAPATSQAAATTLDATGVQLEACDPGAVAAVPANPDVVATLISYQRQRLTP